jgi:hypothetical protein
MTRRWWIIVWFGVESVYYDTMTVLRDVALLIQRVQTLESTFLVFELVLSSHDMFSSRPGTSSCVRESVHKPHLTAP